MPVVLDASVAASWHFPNEVEPVAERALSLIQSDGAIVPAHWWFEIRNTFLIGERRGRLTPHLTREAIAMIERLPIEYRPLSRGMQILELARQHRLTFYDAVYLDMAKTSGALLATLDQELVAAAKREKIALVLAADES